MEPSLLPVQALLLSHGRVQATSAMEELLGEPNLDEEALARFEVGRKGEPPFSEEALPWRRVLAGEQVDELEVWTHRQSGRRLILRARSREVAGEPVLLFVDETEQERALELCGFSGIVARLLLQAGEAHEASLAIVQKVSESFGAPFVALLEPDRSNANLKPSAVVGLSPELGARLSSPLGAETPVARAVRSRTLVEVEDLESLGDDAWGRWLVEHGARALHAVPLSGFGEVAGVLLLARPYAGAFGVAERQALMSAGEAWAIRLQHGRARAAQEKARHSIRAVSEAAFERGMKVPLRDLLRMFVEQARALTGARYGALGVLKKDRTGLEDFIVSGISEEEKSRIAHRPFGKGLLGAVIHEGHTIRVSDIGSDPRSAGFPAHHPQMHSFLGGPLRLGREVYGNFYLTEKEGGGEFTEEDERLLDGLAQQASLTIAYARETNEQRRLLDAVLRQAPHGILFFASERRIAFSNAAAELMMGIDLAHGDPESTGVRLLHPDGRPIEHDAWPSTRALRGETIADQEVRIARPGQEPLPCFVSATPVYTETRTLLGAVVVFQDISTFKELERVREEFAAVVAHDLRNPVQAIMMQAELLQRMAKGPTIQAPISALERMLRNGHRLMHLINDLLDVSRIEGRRVFLDRRRVELPGAVSMLLKQMELTLGDHHATLKIEGAPPAVFVDPMRLDQVLTNLIENAAKYSEPGSPIEITIERSGHGAQISVKDYGVGIAPDDLPKLFDRYFQTKRAREKKSGLGLGLFITKGLVEAHGGKLTVESALGQGSAFRVWLPAHTGEGGCEAHPEV